MTNKKSADSILSHLASSSHQALARQKPRTSCADEEGEEKMRSDDQSKFKSLAHHL